jgi:transposase InsO family protein
MARALQKEGYSVGRHKARSLMREAGVFCRQRRRWRCTTDSGHSLPVAPNRLAREFGVSEPNTVWVADITAIWTLEGWLYLAAVLDLCDRQLVGWAMAGHRRTELVSQALTMALGRRRPDTGLIHHSDRGSQYAAHEYRHLLETNGLVASMSRKGDCWDNAVMERFFGSLKSEWTDTQRYRSLEQARRDVIKFIEMEYNSDRFHSTLGYLTPREKEIAVAA